MINELTNIENQVQPARLRTAFSGHIPGFFESYSAYAGNTKPAENLILEIPSEYFITLEKFKRLFSSEYNRINNSIRDHKMNESEEGFIHYISINYSGVIRMLRNTHAKTPAETDEEDILSGTDFLQTTQDLIYYNLQKLFLLPLKNFIEHTFKTELIQYHLLDSPIDIFLTALQNNKVTLTRYTGSEKNDYQTIYYPNASNVYMLKYNGFSVGAVYNDFLLKKYNDFHKYVDTSLKGTPCNFEKMSLLTRLKVSISELEDLFYKYTSNSTQDFFPVFYRIDAMDNLKRELYIHKSNTCLNNLFPVLAHLTEVQRIFIVRALKFLKGYMKLYSLPEAKKKRGNNQLEFSKSEPFIHYNAVEDKAKLQWRGNINQLITFFYDASNQVFVNGKPILNASKKQIAKLLIENFIQKDGDPVSISTINTIFTPSKELKRPPNNKRIIFPGQE